MIQGTVKWFNDEKGFGFISVPGEEKDVFVHYSAVEGSGRRTLLKDEKVELTYETSDRGTKALRVRRGTL